MTDEICKLTACGESIVTFIKNELACASGLSNPYHWADLKPSEIITKRQTLKRVYIVVGNPHMSQENRRDILDVIREIITMNPDDEETQYTIIRALRRASPYYKPSCLIGYFMSSLERNDVYCRMEAIEGLRDCIGMLEDIELRRQVYIDHVHYPLKSLVRSSEYPARWSAVHVIDIFYEFLSASHQSLLRNIYIQLCYDDTIQVERVALQCVSTILEHSPSESLLEPLESVPERVPRSIESVYIQVLLCGPWIHSLYSFMRQYVVEALPSLERHLDVSAIHAVFMRVIKDASRDRSYIVRQALIKQIPRLVNIAHKRNLVSIINSLFIPTLQRGLEDTKLLINESALLSLKACLASEFDPPPVEYFLHDAHKNDNIYELPSAYTFTKDQIEVFLKILKQIVAGTNGNLKLIIASMLSRIARTIGVKRINEWFLPLMVSLLRQNEYPDAQAEALKHCTTIYEITKNTNASLALIKESIYLIDLESSWRIKLAIAGQFGIITKLSLQGEHYDEDTILERLMILVKDDVHAVRLQATKTCADMVDHMSEQFFLEKILPRFLKIHGYSSSPKQTSLLQLRSVCHLCRFVGPKLHATAFQNIIIPVLCKCLSAKVSPVRMACISATFELMKSPTLVDVLAKSPLVHTILSSSPMANPRGFAQYEKLEDVREEANRFYIAYKSKLEYEYTNTIE